ncbi:MAG: hypothetical protein QF662_06825, partial [Phycisphaerae bacterium]|nr:hypothetical protein [Phycisphaerae bacterium]
GMTVKQAVLVSYVLAIFFGVLGSSVMILRTRYVLVVAVAVFAAIAVAVWKLGMVRVEGPEKTSGH